MPEGRNGIYSEIENLHQVLRLINKKIKYKSLPTLRAFKKFCRHKQRETGLGEEVRVKVQGQWKNRQGSVSATGIRRLQRDIDLLHRCDHNGVRLYSGSQLMLTVQDEGGGEKCILVLHRQKTLCLSPMHL